MIFTSHNATKTFKFQWHLVSPLRKEGETDDQYLETRIFGIAQPQFSLCNTPYVIITTGIFRARISIAHLFQKSALVDT